MATTTPEMGLQKPTEGGDDDNWDSFLNDNLDTLDVHDHSDGKGVTIPVSGLNINADLPMGGYGLSNARTLALAAVASTAVSGYSRALWANSADNELYWRTSGGVNVQLTSGTSLNSALVGGFTGDYGTPAEASYSSSTSIYNFLRDTAHRANLDTADIRLFEGTSGVTNAVKIKSPASLAASYDWVFPAALPGSTSVVQLSSAGVVTASNTIANAVTLSSTLSVAGTSTLAAVNASGLVAAAGAVTVGTTLGVTGASTLAALACTTVACSTVTASGLITANAGVTGGSNQHITVAGSGRFKHPAMAVAYHATKGYSLDGSATLDYPAACWNISNVNDVIAFPLDLPAGKRLLSVSTIADYTGAGNRTVRLFRLDAAAAGTPVEVEAVVVTTNTGWGVYLHEFADATLAASAAYYLTFQGQTSDDLAGLQVSYDEP